MGNTEEVTDCSSQQTSSTPSEQQQTSPVYPNYVVMQAYFPPGMQVPPYFSPPVAPGGHAPPPYIWAPPLQQMMAPYAGMYPHGSVYAHPGVTVAADPNSRETESSSEGSDGNTSCKNGRKISREGSSLSSKVDKTKESDANGGSKSARHVSILGKAVISGNSGNELELKKSYEAANMTMMHTPVMVQAHSNEREMKREKRKQSNRDSAKRSRLRKQAEAEELGKKVEYLTAENLSLKSDIQRLTVQSANLELQNAQLLEKLKAAQAEEAAEEGPRPDNKGLSLSTANLLSRVDNGSGSVVEGATSSGAPLRQLLADAVVVS